MNRTHRSIWNRALGAWVAAPETARTTGGGVGSTPAAIRTGRLQPAHPLRALACPVALACALAWPSLGLAEALTAQNLEVGGNGDASPGTGNGTGTHGSDGARTMEEGASLPLSLTGGIGRLALGGNGGDGGNAGNGGNGGNGTLAMGQEAKLSLTSYSLLVGGSGGDSGSGSRGGSGGAGTLTMEQSAVLSLDSGSLRLGGRGGSGGGNGGGGDGGAGTLTMGRDATLSLLSAENLYVGGNGGNGGNGVNGGTGGAGTLTMGQGATLSLLSAGNLYVGGNGGGGQSGGNGGAGTLTMQQGAQLLLTGANLTVGGIGVLGAGGAGTLTMGQGAQLSLTGTSLGVGGIAFGAGTGGAGTLTMGQGARLSLNGASLTVGGSGSGSGSGGAGTLNLAGALAFSGASSFTINPTGTLNIVNATPGDATPGDASAGSITGLGSLDNNGQIRFNQSDALYRFAPAIQGWGSVVHNAQGTTVLTGASAIGGKTTVAAGQLRFAGNGIPHELSGGVQVQGGATLGIGAGASLKTFNLVTLAESATLSLHAKGGVVPSLQALGGLKIGAGVALNIAGVDAWKQLNLVLIGSTSITGDFSTVLIGGAAGSVDYLLLNKPAKTSNGLEIGYRLQWFADDSTAHGTFTLNEDSEAFTVGAVLVDQSQSALNNKAGWNGTALTKAGAGTLTLTGANTYTGGTTVQAGTLVAGHTQALGKGNVTVGANAALEVNAGVALQVGGNLGLQPGSTYRVAVDPVAGTHGSIRVAGTATLTGATLDVQASGYVDTAQTYTILTADQLSGQFANVKSNYAYLDPKLDYRAASGTGTPTEVQLTLQRKQSGNGNGSGSGPMGFAELAGSGNQRAVANAIESLPSNHPLYQHVLALSAGSPQGFFNSVSGDSHPGIKGQMLRSESRKASGVVAGHAHSNLTAGLRPGAMLAQSDGPLPASAWPSSKALPAWAEVVGHWQSQNGDGNAASSKQHSAGLFVGGDEVIGNGWRLGGSLGYTRADGKVADRSATSTVDSYSAAVYGGKSFGHGQARVNVLGGLAYTWHDIATERQISALGQTLKADYRASTTQLFAEVGYALGQYGKVGVEPFAGITVAQQRTGSFQETGGFAALSGRSSSDTQTSSTLGLRAHSDFTWGRSEGRVRATLGWRHAWGDVQTQQTMAFEGGQNFTVAGTPLARNTALVGLEAELALSRRAALVLGYQGEYGGGARDHSANVKLRWAF